MSTATKAMERDALAAFCAVNSVERLMIGEGVSTKIAATAMGVSPKTARKRLQAAWALGLVIRQERPLAGAIVEHLWYGMFSQAFLKYRDLYECESPSFAETWWSLFQARGYAPGDSEVHSILVKIGAIKSDVDEVE